jgi:hypothetical protein
MSQDYLEKILDSQTLDPDGPELKAIEAEREKIEGLIGKAFPECSPTIKYGGSKAKSTMVKASYDLDIITYFPRDDDDAGGTLKDIYQNVRDTLNKDYLVEEKTSALRLFQRIDGRRGVDFHVDVVPGRYVDDDKKDVFLYQNRADKERLKTNLNIHLSHVQKCGVRPAIRLLKVWRSQTGLAIRTFVLELLAIEILKEAKEKSLDEQLVLFWETVRDKSDDLKVEDPANPNNDLSAAWDLGVRLSAASAARTTLQQIRLSGWEAVFGPTPDADAGIGRTAQIAGLRSLASNVQNPPKPWLENR